MSPAPNPRRRAGRLALAGLAAGLSLAPQFGCTREFFRHYADQDASEAIFEKSRDPRWRLERYTMEPPALSRFANPYDVDRPPAPPDDAATEALTPTPQLPYHRLLVPQEGTGYLDMLEKGRRYQGPPPVEKLPATPMPMGEEALPDVIKPAPGQRNPIPNPPPEPGGPSPFTPSGNSGTAPDERTQNRVPAPSGPTRPTPPPTDTSPPQASRASKDPGVQLTAYQAPAPASTTASPAAGMGAQGPGPASPDALPPPRQDRPPTTTEPVQAPVPDTDPEGPGAVQINTMPVPRADKTAEQIAAERAAAIFLQKLTPILNFNEAEAAGYAPEARPFVVGPAEALQLALMNSRAYQFRLENIYVLALPVTLARFAFQPQFYAGLSPQTAPSGAGIPNNPSNSFQYRTKEAFGGQTSVLSMGTAAGVGKLLSFGGRIVAGFANQTVFNFLGNNPKQPTVVSYLPLSFAQPFLRGGGRAVTLENLTQQERNLVYEIRSFARFRQFMIPTILTQNQPFDNQGTAGTDPTPGYLQILLNLQTVENDRRTVAAYEAILELYKEYVKGGASSGISQIQVDQVAQQLASTRSRLLQDEATFKTNLDSYKMELGLPPDVQLLLDRSPTAIFRKAFNDLDRWAATLDHDPIQLDPILQQMPMLESVIIDGRELFRYKGRQLVGTYEEGKEAPVYADPKKQQEFLLTAERIALENRLDLMNNRAALYDAWRQLAVTANALRGVFTVSVTNQITTPSTSINQNPFAFSDQAKQFSLTFNTELPLIRVNERNTYRLALINYNRAQRLLQSLEDDVKLSVRQEIYNLIAFAESYEIARANLLVTVRQRDLTLQQIIAPPDASAAAGGNASNQAVQTNNLITGINGILTQQQTILQNWVSYQTQRIIFYRDLGLLPYDEWEAYYEFFPAGSGSGGGAAAATGGAGATTPGPAPVPPTSGRP